MNYFIVSQVNDNGDETGLVKLIKGSKEAGKFIMREESDADRKEKIMQSIEKMNVGDFDAINSGKFIYEVDCISEEDANNLEVDDDDLITEEKTAVYEIFSEEKNLSYAFGFDDLKSKLIKMGVKPEDVTEVHEGKEVSFEVTDPEHINISVIKLNDRGIEKLKNTSDSFAIDYEIFNKSKIVESSEFGEKVKDFVVGNYKVMIYKEYNGKFIYVISFADSGKFISSGSLFKTVEVAEEFARRFIESDEFKNTMKLMTESAEPKKYCGHDIAFSNDSGCVSCKITRNGLKIKNYKGFKTIDEASKFSQFSIDCGISESTGDLTIIVINGDCAEKAKEAISKDPYLNGNVEWISDDSFAFDCDGDDDSIISDIKEQLNDFGIDESKISIKQVESID